MRSGWSFWLDDDDMQYVATEQQGVATEVLDRLVRLWAFGRAYSVPKLQVKAMEETINFMEYKQVESRTVRLAFDVASGNMELCEFLVRHIIDNMDETSYEARECYSKDNMLQLGAIDGFLALFVKIKKAAKDKKTKREK